MDNLQSKNNLYKKIFNEYFFGKLDYCVLVELKFKATNNIIFDNCAFFNIYKNETIKMYEDTDYSKYIYNFNNKVIEHNVVFDTSVDSIDKVNIIVSASNQVTDNINFNEKNITETNYQHNLLLDMNDHYILNIIYPVSYSAPIIRIYKSDADEKINNYPIYSLYDIDKHVITEVYNSLTDSKVNTKKTVIKTVNNSCILPLSVLDISEKIFNNSIASKETITYNENGEVVKYYNRDSKVYMNRIYNGDTIIEAVYCDDILINYFEKYTKNNEYHCINHLDYFSNHIIVSDDNSSITTTEISMNGEAKKITNKYISEPIYEFYKDESNNNNISVYIKDSGDTIVYFNDHGIYKIYSKMNREGKITDQINTITTFRSDTEKIVSITYYDTDTIESVYFDSEENIAFKNCMKKDGSFISFTSNNYFSTINSYRSENGSLYEYQDSDFSIELYGDGVVEKFVSVLYGDVPPDNIYLRDIFGIPQLFHKEY